MFILNLDLDYRLDYRYNTTTHHQQRHIIHHCEGQFTRGEIGNAATQAFHPEWMLQVVRESKL